MSRHALPGQLPPNPDPITPEWAKPIIDIVAMAKGFAGWSVVGCFFTALAVWCAGRWFDHHRLARIGVIGMVVACAGGLFYGMGYQLISSFAGG
ncbi:hypothetical protein [Streptoalloteichus hindustanus]|uniref:Uncharacterized protein n=1 Tax=Streptoalloteichus hindustanus TaxID=2017 RepID=A0A1M5M9C6_STRHI|nr:hypothetical protein [Streptoalloteichus hindustanus]SHG73549.1 hypothetical protein SAMN05444320_11329 [Streptoalloteichus hindustanus]